MSYDWITAVRRFFEQITEYFYRMVAYVVIVKIIFLNETNHIPRTICSSVELHLSANSNCNDVTISEYFALIVSFCFVPAKTFTNVINKNRGYCCTFKSLSSMFICIRPLRKWFVVWLHLKMSMVLALDQHLWQYWWN